MASRSKQRSLRRKELRHYSEFRMREQLVHKQLRCQKRRRSCMPAAGDLEGMIRLAAARLWWYLWLMLAIQLALHNLQSVCGHFRD